MTSSVFKLGSLIALIMLITIIIQVNAGDPEFSYDRVHLVDTIHGPDFTNYVFRSNAPLHNSKFDFDLLKKFMSMRAEESGITLPDDIYFVDVSLMNLFDEPPSERDFWPQNPSLGEWVSWPMGLAGLYDAREYDIATRNTMANTTVWEFDQIPQRLRTFIDMIHTPGPINPNTNKPRSKLHFVHCAAGCDRTGAWVIAYRLAITPLNKFTPNTLQDYFKLNVEECGRSPNDWSVKGTEWFCIYMQNNFNVNMGDCLKIADCKRFGSCTWPPAP